MFKDKKREEERQKGIKFIRMGSVMLTIASLLVGIGLGHLKEDEK